MYQWSDKNRTIFGNSSYFIKLLLKMGWQICGFEKERTKNNSEVLIFNIKKGSKESEILLFKQEENKYKK
jgi:hypothetical protein